MGGPNKTHIAMATWFMKDAKAHHGEKTVSSTAGAKNTGKPQAEE